MDGDPILLFAGAVVLLATGVPAFLALGGGGVRDLPIVGAAAVTAALGWILLGWAGPVAVFQGAMASVSMAAVAAPLRARLGRAGAVVAAPILVALVLVPLGVALFDVRSGLLADRWGALDFAGAAALGLVPAVIGAVMAAPAPASPQTSSARRWAVAAGVLAAIAAALLGSELVLDDAAPRLILALLVGASGGAVGWVLASVLLVHAVRVGEAAAGVVAGAISVLAAPLWLDAQTILVIALLSALLGRIVAGRLGRRHAGLVGLLGVPAALGLVAAGVNGDGRGLLASGQTGLVVAQLVTVAVTVALSGGVALVIRGVARWVRLRRAPDDRRRGTAEHAPGAR